MTVPVALVWLAIILALVVRRDLMIYVFNGTVAFGGMTLLPNALTGGLNLPAQTVCAVLLIAMCLFNPALRARIALWALDINKLGVLTLFGAFGAISAMVLPRLFAGTVEIFSLNAAGSESLLSPTSANFTQTVYMFVSIGMVFVMAACAEQTGFLQRFLNSVAVAGIMLALSGIVDFIFGAAGHEELLAGFHTASYNLLDNEMIAGTKRIVGFMPEASMYSQACCSVLGFLMFNYSLYTRRIRRRLLPPLILVLIILTVEATASTGYLGIGAIFGLLGLRMAGRAGFVRWSGGMRFGLSHYFLSAFVVITILVVAVPTSYWVHMQLLLNLMLFQKTSTGSYIERTSWTTAGWHAFYATHGLGVGLGSVRTSNWAVNLLASTGVVGTGLFVLFVLRAVAPVANTVAEPLRRLRRGTILALIPVALMIYASGTTPDPGVWVMSLFGILYGVRLAPRTAPAIAPRGMMQMPGERLTAESMAAERVNGGRAMT